MKRHPVLDGLRSVARLGQTAGIAAVAGIRFATEKPPTAQWLRETFEHLGATYIKLGQFIASSPSLFPREFVEEFQQCLDQTAPLPFSQIESVLKDAFEQPLDQIFASIEHTPLASASIAQVHAARLVTGEDVVIKVQKPGVEAILHTDLGVVHSAMRLMELAMPRMRFAAISDIIDEIRLRMVREVDFVEEAQNCADFQQFLEFTQNKHVVVPKVFPQASTRTVLTMERLYGVPLTDVSVMRQYTRDPSQVLITAMNTWFASLMLCKSFHADLHAGNLMLLTDGRIGFIDFGIVGQLQPKVWQACIRFMESLQHMNYGAMAECMLDMGMTHKAVDTQQLARDLEKVFGVLMTTDPQAILHGEVSDLNALMLDMVSIGERHGIHFPRDFALLMKQMLYFDRFMRVLTPNMDLFGDMRLNLIQQTDPKLLH